MNDLRDFLISLGLEHYVEAFDREEIRLDDLRLLAESDLAELGLPMGPRRRLLSTLAERKGDPNGIVPVGSAGNRDYGERRQLTVLFCDLVGFTELAGRVDPEVLQKIIGAYEDACAVCIARYEGYLFQRLGDGIVAFFGYPLAHEGEAERAINAGLAIIEHLSGLDVPDAGHMAVRIGIATGLVVVSSMEKGAVGETLNLASRLQGIAPVGSIVVSEQVRRLAGGAFEYQDLGEQTLKGIARSTRVFRIAGAGQAASRFEAATQGRLTPLVGREEEIALLMERWAFAQNGEGQVVLLSGEPGIGKSRVLSALRERLEAQGADALKFQCSPYYVNSPLWPSIDNFERMLKFGREEPAESRLDKLEALIVNHYGRPPGDVRFVAAMLSIPHEARYGALPITPQKFKDETRRTLADLTEAVARRHPSVMLFEDLHWADPTSLEVLDLLVDRARSIPLLMVLTHRPEFEPRWSSQSHVLSLNLSRLTQAQSRALVYQVTGGKELPAVLLEQILARTDGVPLFVEELTKSILESGNLRASGNLYESVGATQTIAVPATLRDSLMARLDRFVPVKEIAQIGAAIGREFSYELIAAVAPMAQVPLDAALGQLVDSGLAFRRNTPPEATYTFKHALVQDAAYDSLLKSRRQELHARIARVIEERFPQTSENEPELMARHLTAAGQLEQAIPYWVKAGQLALGRTALKESISHLNRGLELNSKLVASTTRDSRELDIRMLLGTAWWALDGWRSDEMTVALTPALGLAKTLERFDILTQALYGLWVHDLMTHAMRSMTIAREILTYAEASQIQEALILGNWVVAVTHFWTGNLIEAQTYADKVLALYDFDRHHHLANSLNHDPKTLMGIYGHHCLWMLGYPDQAVAKAIEKDEHARRIGHPFDMCFALTLGAHVFEYLYEADQLLVRTREAGQIARERGLPVYEVGSHIFDAVALLRADRAEESLPVFRASIRAWESSGAKLWGTSYIKALFAQALGRSGEMDEARRVIDEVLEFVMNPEVLERWALAEILRIKGWILQCTGDTAGAQHQFQASLDWARRQQAKSWELRTSTSLARLLQSQGKRKEALALLKPVYDWFTEGFDTKDLKEAKALLAELGAVA